ncbi:MAG: HU family DNA-binding protein [Patescibacteria group bacterium]|jgi:DNA-binding protein HU-beta
MNKAELVSHLADKVGVTKKQAEDMVETFVETVVETLKKGGEVNIAGFGAFSAKQRAGRTGVNPQNPTEKIQIPAVTVPKFKAGKGLKDALKASGNMSAPAAAPSPAPSAPTM